ncbi:hypothetical protein CD790_08695 [Streptomyces sp. SAJ15]|nr:hypothetical protein CD790_08695 [Streptomyces sp. SAJ15]
MTEYHRGQGSQPWPAEDPLSADAGWQGQPAGAGHDAYTQAPFAHDPYTQGPYGQDAYMQGAFPNDPYGQPQQYPDQPQDPHQQQWNGQQGGGYPQQAQAGYGDGQGGPYGGGPDPADPYARPVDPYAGAQPDYYATPNAYPPPEPPYARGQGPRQADHAAQGQQAPQAVAEPPAPAREGERGDLADGDDGDDSFFPEGGRGRFVATDEDDADEDDAPAPERRGKKSKRRNGMACLVVTVVLGGFVAGGGYFAYDFWKSRFGSPPDYSGQGTGEVQIEVPQGAVGSEIGNILQREGVVKSTGAFVEAVESSGKAIQPGTYTLRKEMSAASAVQLMTDPASQNGLIVTEGMRNVQVYAAIDKKIGLKAGTTAGIAENEAKNLGLPAWADDNPQIKDPLEGFLFPSRYSVGKGAKPAEVLRQMVSQAKQQYAKVDLEGKSKKLGLKSPLQLVTVASLVQAEGVTHEDFRKMAEVVYNRLKPTNTETNGKLEFDSTYNYIKNQSKIDITLEEIKNYDNPYNTYFYKGLPPGPIGNPGAEALNAAVDPTDEGWYYFISFDGKTSKFTKTYADHKKLVDEFNRQRAD